MTTLPILTNAKGVPFERPIRADYPDTVSWMRAVWAFNDAVAGAANRAFADGLRISLKIG